MNATGGKTMQTYVVLVNYTEDGFETLSELDADEYLEQTKETIRAKGGEFIDFYLTMGQYDAVGIAEFPDDQACTEAILTVLETGIAETETLRAFTEEESRELIATLGE